MMAASALLGCFDGGLALDWKHGPRRVARAALCATLLVVLVHWLEEPLATTTNGTVTAGAAKLEDPLGNARRLRSSPGAQHSETHQHGFMESIGKMLAGPIMILMAIAMLFVNEGRYVRMQTLLSEAMRRVKEIDPADAGSCQGGELIHVVGELSPPAKAIQDTPVKGGFPQVTAGPAAVKLKRVVEMYQWEETKKDEGGQTKYTYTQKWLGSPQDSSHFENSSYSNPPMPCRGTVIYGEESRIGALRVTPRMLGKLQSWKELAVPQDVLRGFRLQGSYHSPEVAPDGKWAWIYFSVSKSNGPPPHPGDPPQVGDVRISYRIVSAPLLVSATGVVSGDHLEPMRFNDDSMKPRLMPSRTTDFNLIPGSAPREEPASLDGADDFEDEPGVWDDIQRGLSAVKEADFAQLLSDWTCCCLGCGLGLTFFHAAAPAELFVVSEGKKSPKQHLKAASAESNQMLWAMRFLGFFVMWGGIQSLFDPLMTLFRFIPFLGGFLVAIISTTTCFCACGGSLFTAASAWIIYRPLAGLALVAASIFIVGLGFLASGGVSSQPQVTSSTLVGMTTLAPRLLLLN